MQKEQKGYTLTGGEKAFVQITKMALEWNFEVPEEEKARYEELRAKENEHDRK